ncbi:hypothetical protein [Mammaliicoccus sciuri]|uniref:hypothetical protein n=1 Tax=Mammaliicoccus sciuri TaxID=1296 RepID=UPI002DBB4A1B|nr:hypothetical protein [Mammaliicoccus sciuri]MEB6232632.1 hypothetical protein [Mammaliicoccus sciuri]
MSNLLNEIKFVEYIGTSTLQMKQGDLTPIYIELIGVKKTLRNTSPSTAQVFLISTDNSVAYKKEAEVSLGQLKLIIEKTLPVGRYHIEINHEGRIYPSNNSHNIQVNASADLN